MGDQHILIPISDSDTVSGIVGIPEGNPPYQAGIIFAHGAANDMNHPSLADICRELEKRGYLTLRFNFPYKDRQKKSPDPEKRLIQTWQQVMAYLSQTGQCRHIIAAGKSLGGRMASQAAADHIINPDGLIFLGYPLHAPGKKQQLRDAHLYRLSQPLLFFQGSRDPFCDLNLFQGVYDQLSATRSFEVIENGDHSFKLPKSDPRSMPDIHQDIASKIDHWILSILPSGR